MKPHVCDLQYQLKKQMIRGYLLKKPYLTFTCVLHYFTVSHSAMHEVKVFVCMN